MYVCCICTYRDCVSSIPIFTRNNDCICLYAYFIYKTELLHIIIIRLIKYICFLKLIVVVSSCKTCFVEEESNCGTIFSALQSQKNDEKFLRLQQTLLYVCNTELSTDLLHFCLLHNNLINPMKLNLYT